MERNRWGGRGGRGGHSRGSYSRYLDNRSDQGYGDDGSIDENSPSNWVPGVGKRPPHDRGGRYPPDPNRPRPPAHLRGREIGLWHARNSRGGKEKRKDRDIGDRAVISLKNEDYLTSLVNEVKKEESDGDNHQGCSFNVGGARNIKQGKKYKETTLTRNPAIDNKLYEESQNHDHQSKSYEKLLSFRRQLPSYKMRDAIITMIRENQVSLISGETGCGKTTQVAQFILDDYIARRCGSTCHIICTQPRRISAISVAERVASERNETVGNSNSCGYQIRLEWKLPRERGSILYCTLGVLLRFMIGDPNMIKVSHIILDEIHERDTLSDFLLIIIKDLLPMRPDLKIILMSATLNAAIFSTYFANCPQLEIPGSAYNVQDYYLEDIMGMITYRPDNSRKPAWGRYKKQEDKEEYFRYLDSIEANYPPNVVSRLREMEFKDIDMDLVVAVIMHIQQKLEDGAILVFLPGWSEISKLHKALTGSPVFGNSSRYKIIPLHSRLPTASQRDVFERPPPGCRKIVIATNIAETSITIDDVVCVIDSGKDKSQNFNMELNVSSLDCDWISKASEKQRRGRAGRVQDGHCFHLFTMFHRSKFRDFLLPEILRTPLDSLCLQIKILELGKMWEFLSKAIEPPLEDMCKLAIKSLVQMTALDKNENLTSLGYHLALLPVSPKIGRMILFGAIFSCLDPVLTVAGSLDSKDPFFAPLGKEKEADRQKRILSEDSKSDHIALINAFKGWEHAKDTHSEGNYCWENFLSKFHLNFINGTKKQFAQLLHGSGFIQSPNPKHVDNNINSENINLVKAVICAGLYPNVAKIEYNYKGTRVQRIHTVDDVEKELRVELHPKSVNSQVNDFQSQWLIYHEKMKITKVFLFDTTMISPYPLLFFGGAIRYHQDGGQDTIEVDKGIKFHSSIETAKLVMQLRMQIDKLLGKKIRNPAMKLVAGGMDAADEKILAAVIDLITQETINAKRCSDLQDDQDSIKTENNATFSYSY